MKGASELLGVTYASLYGRYRESFGYLRKTKQTAKADFVLQQMREKFSGSGNNTEEEEGNYEDTLMEVQSDVLANNKEDLEDQFAFEDEAVEKVVEKVLNHYGSNNTS